VDGLDGWGFFVVAVFEKVRRRFGRGWDGLGWGWDGVGELYIVRTRILRTVVKDSIVWICAVKHIHGLKCISS